MPSLTSFGVALFAVALGKEAAVRAAGAVEFNLTSTVSRCCCNDQRPDPKYICADLTSKQLFSPSLPKKPRGSSESLRFTSQVFQTSHCEGGKAVEHQLQSRQSPAGLGDALGSPEADARSSEADTPAWAQAIVELRSSGDSIDDVPAWASSAAEQATKLGVPSSIVHTVYRVPLSATFVDRSESSAPLQDLQLGQWRAYEFGAAKSFPKYKSTPGYTSKVLRAKHFEYNGVIYGPVDEHGEKPSVHGEPYCSLWEKAADVTVTKVPKFSAETNSWTFKTSCTEKLLCRDYKIGHACGFDHSDTVLLKRVGRRGECADVESTWGKGTHCPSGQFHNSVNKKLGGTTWKFCDCRSAASPGGECRSDKSAWPPA